MKTVFVVGSINMDLVSSVARLPLPGETVAGGALRLLPGGKGANQAVAAARVGARVRLVGHVGGDAFGAAMRAFLKGEGIAPSGIKILKDETTGTALIAVSQDSQNTIIVTPGANGVWQKAEVEALPLKKGDGLVCQLEIPTPIVEAAFRAARKAGATTFLNPSPVASFSPRLLKLTDLLVVNEIELAALSGAQAFDELTGPALRAAGEALAAKVGRGLIVTLGAQGVMVFSHEGNFHLPARKVRAKDTTGAGDGFMGALAARIVEGASLLEAATFANIAASLSVTREGAAPSLATRAEILAAAR